MDNKHERNQFVDIMRGIAMLLVVLGHTMTGCTTGAENSFLFNIVWSLQMPLFILISGYVTRYSRGIDNGTGLWKYVKRRTIAYLLPWVVWSFLVRGIIFGQSNFLNIKWLLWHMDSGYWFLATIWTISLIFGISTFLAKRFAKDSGIKQNILTLILYIAGMAILAGIGLLAGLSFFAIKLTLYYMPFYFAGYLYGQYRDKIFETKWGKIFIDVIIACCVAGWLFVLNRYHLYALPDNGIAIVLRAISSITGCIAVCGLCKGFLSETAKPLVGGGISQLMRGTFARDLSHPLPVTDSAEDAGGTDNGKYSRDSADASQLSDHGSPDNYCGQVSEHKQNIETGSVWKQRISKGFLWAGEKSLEIYMVHGLLLDVLMPEVKPIFPSIMGYGLISGNFVITIILCVVIISLISQNNVLKKLLGMK